MVSVADRAAEQVTHGWRTDSAGSALLAEAEASRARGERAKREFESVFGDSPPSGSADDPQTAETARHQRRHRGERAPGRHQFRPVLTRPASAVTRAVSAWQDQLMRLVQAENLAKRAGGTTYDVEPLSLVTLIAMLGEDGDARDAGDAAAARSSRIPTELLASAFGAFESKNLIDKARADLTERVRLLLDEELLRFIEVLDQVGPVDPIAAVRLYQAEYSLEAAR